MLHALTDLYWTGAGHNLPTTLPGRLHQTLLTSGVLGDSSRELQSSRARTRRRVSRGLSDPTRGFQSRCGEWAALRPWTLRGTAPLKALESERIFLVAQGVHGEGMLRIDGEDVCPFTDGDFEIEITTQTIEKESARIELAFAPTLPLGFPPRVRIGVDGGLFLRGINQIRITGYKVSPRIVDGYGLIESTISVTPYMPGRYIFRYAVVFGEETLATEEFTERFTAAETRFTHRVVLPLPKQWRASEDNELAMIRLTVTRAGLVCDDRILHTGFRYVSFAENIPTQLLLGGERLFLTGAEWKGCEESLLTRDQIDQRLSLLKRAHINCVRVYGAETDMLYDALDRQGFLLWQILPKEEGAAIAIIRRVRHRPSLIAYGMESVYAMPDHPAGLLHPAVRVIAEAVRAHDGMTRFFGPIPGEDITLQDAENSGYTVKTDVIGPMAFPGPEALFSEINLDDALIRTICCPAPANNLAELSGGEVFWPPDNPLWTHRAPSQIDLAALSAWFEVEVLTQSEAVHILRALQAETVRYAVEGARIRQSTASGVFVADPFERLPSLCSTAMFDESGPRPAYWALESALRPVHACAARASMTYPCGAQFHTTLFLLCNSLVMGLLTVRAQLHMEDGCILAETVYDVNPETAQIGTLVTTLPDFPCVLVLRLTVERFGEIIDISDSMLCVSTHSLLGPLQSIEKTAVSFQDGTVYNAGNHVALSVCGPMFEAAYYPGWGVLFPGETRKVAQEGVVEALNLQNEPSDESFGV